MRPPEPLFKYQQQQIPGLTEIFGSLNFDVPRWLPLQRATREDYSIGIDLGTSFCCAAVWRNGQVEIIPNRRGERTTSSYVSFTDDERIIGNAAKNLATRNPLNTVFNSKRLIGRKFNDPIVQADADLYPFRVTAGPNDKPLVWVSF